MRLSLLLACALCLGGVAHAQKRNQNTVRRKKPASAGKAPAARPAPGVVRPPTPAEAPPGGATNPARLPQTNQPLQGFGFGTRLNANTVSANNNAGTRKKKKKRHRRRYRRAAR